MKRSQIRHLISSAGPVDYKDKWFGSANNRPGRCSLCRREFYSGNMVDYWYEGRKLHVIHHSQCPRKLTKAQIAKRLTAARKLQGIWKGLPD